MVLHFLFFALFSSTCQSAAPTDLIPARTQTGGQGAKDTGAGVHLQGRSQFSSIIDCPDWLKRRYVDDRSPGRYLLSKTEPPANCRVSDSAPFRSETEIEEYLLTHSSTRFANTRAPWVTAAACLTQAKEGPGTPGGLSFTQAERKTLLLEYYALLNGAGLAEGSEISEIARLDLLLGSRPFAKGNSCEDKLIHATQVNCSFVKSCFPQDGAGGLFEQSFRPVLQSYLLLKKYLGDLEGESKPTDVELERRAQVNFQRDIEGLAPTSEERRNAFQKKAEPRTLRQQTAINESNHVREAIASLQARYPILRGKLVEQNLASLGNGAKPSENIRVLKAQFRLDRQAHLDKLSSLRAVSQCLSSSSAGRECSGIEETLKTLPDFVSIFSVHAEEVLRHNSHSNLSPAEKNKLRRVADLFGAVGCRQAARTAKQTAGELNHQIVEATEIAVLTAGVGVGASLALKGVQGLEAAQAARLIDAALESESELERAQLVDKTVENSRKVAALSRLIAAAPQGLDLILSAGSFRNDLIGCEVKTQRKVKEGDLEGSFERTFSASARINSCPIAANESGTTYVQEEAYSRCLLGALAKTLPNLLPIVVPFIGKTVPKFAGQKNEVKILPVHSSSSSVSESAGFKALKGVIEERAANKGILSLDISATERTIAKLGRGGKLLRENLPKDLGALSQEELKKLKDLLNVLAKKRKSGENAEALLAEIVDECAKKSHIALSSPLPFFLEIESNAEAAGSGFLSCLFGRGNPPLFEKAVRDPTLLPVKASARNGVKIGDYISEHLFDQETAKELSQATYFEAGAGHEGEKKSLLQLFTEGFTGKGRGWSQAVGNGRNGVISQSGSPFFEKGGHRIITWQNKAQASSGPIDDIQNGIRIARNYDQDGKLITVEAFLPVDKSWKPLLLRVNKAGRLEIDKNVDLKSCNSCHAYQNVKVISPDTPISPFPFHYKSDPTSQVKVPPAYEKSFLENVQRFNGEPTEYDLIEGEIPGRSVHE